ncbi:MAG TPA: pitrilysin family protein [candidate division Zixibacteria bacterium]|nr:pitrilysin family protein [candidate division Zixibacteria bacterium]
MKRLTILLIFTASLLLCMAVQAVDPRDMKFEPQEFTPPQPERWELDNGLVVFFLPNDEIPIFTARALFHGGTIYDPSDRAGLSEVMTSAMRSGGAGGRTPDAIDEALDFVAADISANASSDRLSFGMRCLIEDIDSVSVLFADVLMKPDFDSTKTAMELSNLENEILRQNDNPHAVSRRVFYQTVYKDHPYGRYATLKSIAGIGVSDVASQHDAFISPSNCILSISGAISSENVKQLVEKLFGDWTGPTVVPITDLKAADQFTPGVYYAEKDINQANIRFGHRCLDDHNPDRFAFDVMNFALGGSGFTSRLTREVRTTQGLAYSVGSYLNNRPLGGVFFGYCQTRADQLSQALNSMLEIIRQVRDSGITQEELSLAKESIINNFVFNFVTPSQIVNAQAELEFDGFPVDQLSRDLEAYREVTREDCNRVAREYLQPDHVAIVVVGQRTMFDKPLEQFGKVIVVPMEIE